MTRREWIDEDYEGVVVLDGLDEAIAGIVEMPDTSCHVVYDEDLVVQVFIERDRMTYEEAVDWFEFNVVRTCDALDRNGPLILRKGPL